jgi:predicted transcriptional regulator of viral defense system
MNKRSYLIQIAADQGGYFTAQQALAAGYTYQEQRHHVTHGNWVREGRAVYRLPEYPIPSRSDLIVLTLLSHNRAGEPQAIVSHETALAIHEISDANPARIHLTVPPGFKKSLSANVVIYRNTLNERDWEQREGYRVTTPLRTILDIADTPASWPYLPDAVYDALQLGLVRPTQLLLIDGNQQTKAWIRSAVEAAEQKAQRTKGRA